MKTDKILLTRNGHTVIIEPPANLDASYTVTMQEGGSGGVSAHGQLTGLDDDAHTQYLNTTRGDARYYTQTQIDTALQSYAPTNHSHLLSDVSGLTLALDGKANTSHTHAIADVTGLQTALDGKETAGAAAAAISTHLSAFDHGAYLTSAAIGSTIQAFDADLGAIAALTPSTGHILIRGASAWESRALAEADIPNISAAKITSGTLNNSRLPSSISVSSLTSTGNLSVGTGGAGTVLFYAKSPGTGFERTEFGSVTSSTSIPFFVFRCNPGFTQYQSVFSATNEGTQLSETSAGFGYVETGYARFRNARFATTHGLFAHGYTLAALPSANSQSIAYATDGRKPGEGAGAGTGVPVWRDGSVWRSLVTGLDVAESSSRIKGGTLDENAFIPHTFPYAESTGGAVEVALGTYTMPGGTLKAGDVLRFEVLLSYDTAGVSKTFKLRLGGSEIYANTLASSVSVSIIRSVFVRSNALVVFNGPTSSTGYATGNNQPIVISVNLANTILFEILGTPSNAAHKIICEGGYVEVLKK